VYKYISSINITKLIDIPELAFNNNISICATNLELVSQIARLVGKYLVY